MFSRTWDMVTDTLGLIRNPSKDAEGTCVKCLGIEIDTITMEARLSPAKLSKALHLVINAFTIGRLTKL